VKGVVLQDDSTVLQQQQEQEAQVRTMQYLFRYPNTAYTLGDVLHHSTGQGEVWMLLVIDIFYQVQKPLFPLSLYQIQQQEGLVFVICWVSWRVSASKWWRL
jgi:hypothetical protein